MSTIKQKGSVKDMVEKVGKPIGEIMIENGYSPNTSLTPQKLTESKGFKAEMAKYGLTEELVSSALVKDIESKAGKRLPELSLGAEILGMKKKEESNQVHIDIEQLIVKFNKILP